MNTVILLLLFALVIFGAAKSNPDGLAAKIAKYVIALGTALFAAGVALVSQFGGG